MPTRFVNASPMVETMAYTFSSRKKDTSREVVSKSYLRIRNTRDNVYREYRGRRLRGLPQKEMY